MSLFYFHILLIATALVFFFGLGVWSTETYLGTQKVIDLATGIFSFFISLVTVFYLVWFLRKNRGSWKQQG